MELPNRLAGTARQYSTNAINQLATITPNSGTSLKRRCPYHAVVMNTLEPISMMIGRSGNQMDEGGIGVHRELCGGGFTRASYGIIPGLHMAATNRYKFDGTSHPNSGDRLMRSFATALASCALAFLLFGPAAAQG